MTNTHVSSLKKAEARSALARTESESLPEKAATSTTRLEIEELGKFSINLNQEKDSSKQEA